MASFITSLFYKAQGPELSPDDMVEPKTHRSICGPGQPFDTWRRAFFENEGCTIYAWPSRGGVIIKQNADLVDLAFLGFDRFSPPTHRFPDDEQENEDGFARMLLRTGGKFWRSQQRSANVAVNLEEGEGDELIWRFIGWEPPNGSGGVWVFEYDVEEGEEPTETGKLRMCITMEERCMVLKSLGAKFYADPKEYEGLKWAYDNELFCPPKEK